MPLTILEPKTAPRKQLEPTVMDEFPAGKEVIQIDPEIGALEPQFYPGGCFLIVQRHFPDMGATGLLVKIEGQLTLARTPAAQQQLVCVPQAQTKSVGILKRIKPNARTQPGTVLWINTGLPMTQGCFMVVRQVNSHSLDGFIYQPRYVGLEPRSPEVSGKWSLHYQSLQFVDAYVVGKAPWVLTNVPAPIELAE